MTTTKAALITGASRGLGLALARQLARMGWTLILDARGGEALELVRAELEPQTRVIGLAGDVTDPIHRQQMASAAQSVGGLDAVVNNASILGPSPQPKLMDYPLDVLEQVYRANVIAPLGILQAVSKHLKPDARIINVTSDAGVEPYAGWGGYGSSKAAFEHLTAILAAENPSWKVHWVDPGDMRTQMHQEAFPGEDISDRPLPEVSVPGLVALLEGDYPNGRYKAQKMLNEDASNSVQEMRTVLTVENFEAATTFYRDGFGLKVVEQWDRPDGKGVILSAPNATLELLDTQEANRVDQIEAGKAVSGTVRLGFQVGDVEAAGKHLVAQGAEAVNDVVDTPWGDRNQRLQSADGIQITLFERSNDAAKS